MLVGHQKAFKLNLVSARTFSEPGNARRVGKTDLTQLLVTNITFLRAIVVRPLTSKEAMPHSMRDKPT